MKRKKRKAAAAYAAIRQGTEAGKILLDPANRTQRALIYRAIGAGAARFEDVLAAIRPALRGKKITTMTNNARWYLQDLKRHRLIRSKR